VLGGVLRLPRYAFVVASVITGSGSGDVSNEESGDSEATGAEFKHNLQCLVQHKLKVEVRGRVIAPNS